MASPLRIDRQFFDQRRPKCATGLINEAQGSCRYHLGKSTATSVVYGPSAPKYSRHEDYAGMNLEVTYSTSLGGGSGAGDALVGAGQEMKRVEREGAKFIRAGLLPAIDISRCPRTLLVIKVIVDFDDGNSLCTAFNACVIALLNAGVSMLYTPVAVGTAYITPTNSTNTIFTSALTRDEDGDDINDMKRQDKSLKVLCADPNKEEESHVLASFLLVLRGSADQQVVLSRCRGRFTEYEFEEAVALSDVCASALMSFIRTISF